MRERFRDLNELAIPCTDDAYEWRLPDWDPEYVSESAPVECFFRDVRARLLERLGEYPIAFGCVAWLTEPSVLDALARMRAAVVVQKEARLRNPSDTYNIGLRAAYARITGLSALSFGDPLSRISDPSVPLGVRCVGYAPEGTANIPRMHHKFLVVAHPGDASNGYRVRPAGVWTGSFNFTRNGHGSLENAVFIRTPAVVHAYLDEFQQIAAMSESLDYRADEPNPAPLRPEAE